MVRDNQGESLTRGSGPGPDVPGPSRHNHCGMKSVDDQTISARGGRSGHWSAAILASAVTVAGVFGPAVGTASADTGGACLWAGAPYAQGTTVVAGGWTFTCGSAGTGDARWNRGSSANRPSTVANPGAAADPTGRFSAGAIQPGTEYTDYCVGEQLVSGSDAMYEVVAEGAGLRWRAVGPIAHWRFDQGEGHVPTSQSASRCRMDPQY
ncbi:hypothetical protein GCM10011610_59980 [Nocardia rhizosphaerihabitans]|uniref:Ig-like domain-containing protein n=2 Tax=Nocardia rhizosphaerihabitans TaxID=1691570 RepID=A0ABQ2KXE7_9NOCA|nr:hypothetical protein GCM10011610_59980 [Nocardia rhizosphaerihabitans]